MSPVNDNQPLNIPVVVVLSGGLDSTTCMAIAAKQEEKIFALTFAYNQRHHREIKSAVDIAEYYGARHRVIDLGTVFAASALTAEAGSVPRTVNAGTTPGGVPATYVPARNILFLAYALAWAEMVGAGRIYLGVNALDNPGYPDCRPEFIAAFQQVIDTGTAAGTEGKGVKVMTPLLRMTKFGIIRLALQLRAPLHLTHTCYQGEAPACGHCAGCRQRLAGFQAVGVPDPLPYRRQ
ncbi:MAG: 7-cyano-7-deazaguanine synthase QueC [Heliobacteriaceae bacterium]|nr:7-cyano-7-deazaguanine synthase QueC [Heliobacteriaceae bacterium]MDD4587501.1 7-cyano-7-deazaguanine synthase QueC [Heliobacteriaceae bacterium]